MSKYKYYSLNNIKKKNATYNVIFGERSNGKTYAVLKEALKLFKDEGKQFAYVRRWQTDIRGRRSQAIFSALEANGEIEKIFNGQYTGVYYYAGRFYLCTYDDNGKNGYVKMDQMYYFKKDNLEYQVIGCVLPDIFNLLIEFLQDSDFPISAITDNL